MINKKDKQIIIIIIALATIIAAFLIFKAINNIRNIKGNPADISYTSNAIGNIKYLVYLKNNKYLTQDYLDSTYSYLTDLVEYIKTDFTYQYSMDKYKNFNYSYQINSKIIAHNADQTNPVTKPLWQKEEILLNPVNVSNSKSAITINKQLNISIIPYLDEVEAFKNAFNVSATFDLEINLIVNINGKTKENTDFNKQHITTMTIPLSVKAFDITTSKNFDEKEIIYNKEQLKKETGYMWAIIYIVMLFIDIGGGIFIIKYVIDCNYSKYSLEKKKIIKEYDDRIVQVSRFIKYDNWEIVDINSFEELLDLSNEAFEPIFFWERKLNHTKEAWFSIIRDKVLYRYILYHDQIKK